MGWAVCEARHTPTINHEASLFTENKRYLPKPRAIADVVNRNADSVYQTEQVFNCSESCVKGAYPTRPMTNSTEYVDVRKNLSCAPRERVVPLLRP